MASKKSDVKRAIADRDYWLSFIKSDEWQLIGFTFRDAARFCRKRGHGCIEVNRGHLEMLGLERVGG